MLIMICNLKYNWDLPAQDTKKKEKRRERDGGLTVNDTNAGFLRWYSLNFLKQERKKKRVLELPLLCQKSKTHGQKEEKRIENLKLDYSSACYMLLWTRNEIECSILKERKRKE